MPVENTLITFDYKKNSTISRRSGYENRSRGTVEVNETRSGIFKKLIIDSKGSTEKCYMLIFDTDKLEYRKFKMTNVKNIKNGLDRNKTIERDEEEEAKARNLYMKICYGKIPSYSLWDAFSVGPRDTWKKWWEESDQEIMNSNKIKIKEPYKKSLDNNNKIRKATKRKGKFNYKLSRKRKYTKDNTDNILDDLIKFIIIMLTIFAVVLLLVNLNNYNGNLMPMNIINKYIQQFNEYLSNSNDLYNF